MPAHLPSSCVPPPSGSVAGSTTVSDSLSSWSPAAATTVLQPPPVVTKCQMPPAFVAGSWATHCQLVRLCWSRTAATSRMLPLLVPTARQGTTVWHTQATAVACPAPAGSCANAACA